LGRKLTSCDIKGTKRRGGVVGGGEERISISQRSEKQKIVIQTTYDSKVGKGNWVKGKRGGQPFLLK